MPAVTWEKWKLDYKAAHDKISDLYYRQKAITKADFERLHTALHLHQDRLAIASGKQVDWPADPDPQTSIGKMRSTEVGEMLSGLNVKSPE